jgi:hypothetical protein
MNMEHVPTLTSFVAVEDNGQGRISQRSGTGVTGLLTRNFLQVNRARASNRNWVGSKEAYSPAMVLHMEIGYYPSPISKWVSILVVPAPP